MKADLYNLIMRNETLKSNPLFHTATLIFEDERTGKPQCIYCRTAIKSLGGVSESSSGTHSSVFMSNEFI